MGYVETAPLCWLDQRTLRIDVRTFS